VAVENHLRAVNDNHDIANRRIPIAPDLDFRRSVFAGHRNIFFRPERGLYFTARKPTDSILSDPGGSGRIYSPRAFPIKARNRPGRQIVLQLGLEDPRREGHQPKANETGHKSRVSALEEITDHDTSGPANRSRFEQVCSKLDSPAEQIANVLSGLHQRFSPEPFHS
jgi:hypothetical protein